MKFPRTILGVAVASLLGGAFAQTAYDDHRGRLPGREGPGLACLVADLDVDGRCDLVRATDAGIEVLQQDDAGAFRVIQSFALSLAPGASIVSLRAGRLRGGTVWPDVVVGVTGDHSRILDNDGTGLLTERLPTPLPRPGGFSGATSQILVGDLDLQYGDDVVVLHDSAMPQVFVQQAGGGFVDQASAFFPPGFFPQSPAGVLADFDNDSLLDLVLIRRGLSVVPTMFASAGGTGFVIDPTAFSSVGNWIATGICAGDTTGDGRDDVLLTSTVMNPGLRVLANDGSATFALSTPLVGFSVGPARDAAVGNVTGGLENDLVVLHVDGSVELAEGQSGFVQPRLLLGPGDRGELVLTNLDPAHDGDLDVFVGGGEDEDCILLGNRSNRLYSTEETTMPTGTVVQPHHLALLDVSGEGDLDVVGYDFNGNPLEFVNDGGARFRRDVRLPSLAPSTVLDVVTGVLDPGTRSLFVLGTRPGGATVGVNVLMVAGGAVTDETATRWPVPPPALAAFAVGDFVRTNSATIGRDDVVAVDAGGVLHLFANQNGVFTEVPGFGGAGVPGAVRLVIGDLDADARLDVVVLKQGGTPSVFRGQAGGGFAVVPMPIVGSFTARDGLVTEVTGDGIADLLVVSSTTPALAVLRGNGDGTFTNAPAFVPANLPAGLNSVSAIGGSSSAQPSALVFASNSEHDVVYQRVGTAFGLRSRLPSRGSLATTRVLVGDLDTDNDADLVIVRAASMPAILFDQRLQLSSLTPVQLGRSTAISISAPEAGAAAVFIGPNQARVRVSVFGLLRIDPSFLLQLLATSFPGAGRQDFVFPTSPAWPQTELLIQVAFINDPGTLVQLGNLDYWTLTGY